MTNEHYFNILFERMGQGVIFQNADGTIALINPAAKEILGASEPHLHDVKTIDDNLKFIHEGGSPYPAKDHPAMITLRTGQPVKNEVMGVYVPASQTYRWILINTVPLFNSGASKPYQAFVSFEDITELKCAQEAFQESERRYRGLVSNLDAALKQQPFEITARTIFDQCKKVTGAVSGYVALLSDDGAENKVLFLDSGGLECIVDPYLPMPIRGLRGQAYHQGKAVFDNNFMGSEWMKFMPAEHVRLDNVLFAPLMIDNKAVGLIGLANKPEDFIQKDAEVVTALCNLVAIALNNSRNWDALLKKEDKYRQLAENTEAIPWEYDVPSDCWTYVAPQCEKILGYKPEEWTDLQFWVNHIHQDDREWASLYCAECVKAGRQHTFEYRFLKKNGDKIWLRDIVSVEMKDGNPVKLRGIMLDINEIKKTEAIAVQNATQRQILLDLHRMEDNTEQDIFEFTLEAMPKLLQSEVAFIGTINANESEMVIYSWSKDAMRQCAITDSPIHYPIAEAGLWGEVVRQRHHIIINDYNSNTELKKGYPTGHVPIKRFLSVPVFKSGRIVAVGAAANKLSEFDDDDITALSALLQEMWNLIERKRSEIENQKLRDKAEMNARLATVGEMAAGIAHEINNPLTGVIGFSELLQERKDLPPDVMENLQIINSGSVRVKEIVKRMLTFARQAKPTKSSVSVNELLDNTIEMRSYVLKTANIEVVKDYDPDLPLINADPGQLQQVFLNLIVNAEFAMKKVHDKGKLTITSRKPDDTHIAVNIADDGPGMTEAVQAKLFQPFFTTKDPGEGTGLGLSLSRSIILEHNGTIEVDSKLGVGTTFTIKFPLIQSQDIEPKTTPEARRARRVVSSAHVLVVDDEPTIRALIKSILSMQGHLVEDTDNPQQALKMLGESHFDLIFLDIRMPGMSGMELHEIILTRWPKQAENIVFVTGDNSDLLIREYLATHQIPYISKPFDRATLEKVAGEVLAKPSR
ncbi:MAG: GAF domain-containing protein [Dehalogenimonas sp.]